MTTEPTRELLAVRLARIMGTLGPVAKKGKISSQGSGPTYKFARDADVLEAVIPEMAKEGIILVPEHTELLSMGPNLRETQLLANIRTDWHVTDGVESIRFETFGQGQDSGDKALPKAMTNSRKYALFMLYHIVTGDDPDMHASDQPYQRPTEQPGGRPSRAAASSQGATDPAPAGPSLDQIKARLLEVASEHHLGAAALDLLIEDYVPKGSTPEQVRAGLIELGTNIGRGQHDGGVSPGASGELTAAEQMSAEEAIAAGAALVGKS